MLDLPYTEARAGVASREFVAKHPNTRYTVADYNTVELPQNLDVVLNVLYYHDLPLNKIDTAALNAKILKALKPGGIYFIVDHNAAPGSGMRDTEKLHRIDPAVIKQEVLASGFELVAESKLLANPDGRSQLDGVLARQARHHRPVGLQVPQAAEVGAATRVARGASRRCASAAAPFRAAARPARAVHPGCPSALPRC